MEDYRQRVPTFAPRQRLVRAPIFRPGAAPRFRVSAFKFRVQGLGFRV